jgi:hypothetical protein
MSLFLLTSEIGIAIQKFHNATPTQPLESAQRLQTVHDLTAYIEGAYLRHCNINIPIQKVAWLSTRSLLAKFEFIIHQQGLNNEQPHELVSLTAEHTLLAACLCLEQSLELQTDDLLRGFRWLFASYNQFHCLTYILWHLCAQPSGPHVMRAWKVVDLIFDVTESDLSRPDPGPIWKVLQHLREKATQRRQTETTSSPTRDAGPSEDVTLERRSGEEPPLQEFDVSLGGPRDILAPDIDPSSLSEWINLSETLGIFQFDS